MSVINQALRDIDSRRAMVAAPMTGDALMRAYAASRISRPRPPAPPTIDVVARPAGSRWPVIAATSTIAGAVGAAIAIGLTGGASRDADPTPVAVLAQPAAVSGTVTAVVAPAGSSVGGATAAIVSPAAPAGADRGPPAPADAGATVRAGTIGTPWPAAPLAASPGPTAAVPAAVPPSVPSAPARSVPAPAIAAPPAASPAAAPRSAAPAVALQAPAASLPVVPANRVVNAGASGAAPAAMAAVSARTAAPAPTAVTASTVPGATGARTAGAAATATIAAATAAPAPVLAAVPADPAAPAAAASSRAGQTPANAGGGMPGGASAARAPAAVPAPVPAAAPSSVETRAEPAQPPAASTPSPAPAPVARQAAPAPAAPVALAAAAASVAVPSAPAAAPTISVQPRPAGTEQLQALASSALAAGDLDEAQRLLRAALAIDPLAHTARQALLALLGRGERGAAWVSALEEAASVAPERFGLVAARGLADAGRLDAALVALARVPTAQRNVEYLTTVGLLGQRAGRHALAVESLGEALARTAADAPTVPALRVALADSLAARGNATAAREQLDAVLSAPNARAELRALARDRLAGLPLP